LEQRHARGVRWGTLGTLETIIGWKTLTRNTPLECRLSADIRICSHRPTFPLGVIGLKSTSSKNSAYESMESAKQQYDDWDEPPDYETADQAL
jgi:hypothetical protein